MDHQMMAIEAVVIEVIQETAKEAQVDQQTLMRATEWASEAEEAEMVEEHKPTLEEAAMMSLPLHCLVREEEEAREVEEAEAAVISEAEETSTEPLTMQVVTEAVVAEAAEEVDRNLIMMAMVADKKEEDVAAVGTTTSTINLAEVKVMTGTSEEEETKKKLATRSDKEIEDVVATLMQEPTNELNQCRKC